MLFSQNFTKDRSLSAKRSLWYFKAFIKTNVRGKQGFWFASESIIFHIKRKFIILQFKTKWIREVSTAQRSRRKDLIFHYPLKMEWINIGVHFISFFNDTLYRRISKRLCHCLFWLFGREGANLLLDWASITFSTQCLWKTCWYTFFK